MMIKFFSCFTTFMLIFSIISEIDVLGQEDIVAFDDFYKYYQDKGLNSDEDKLLSLQNAPPGTYIIESISSPKNEKSVRISYIKPGEQKITSLTFSPSSEDTSGLQWQQELKDLLNEHSLKMSFSFFEQYDDSFFADERDEDLLSLSKRERRNLLKFPDKKTSSSTDLIICNIDQFVYFPMLGDFYHDNSEVLRLLKNVKTLQDNSFRLDGDKVYLPRYLEKEGLLIPELTTKSPIVIDDPLPPIGSYIFTNSPLKNQVNLIYIDRRGRANAVDLILHGKKFIYQGEIISFDELGDKLNLSINIPLFRQLQYKFVRPGDVSKAKEETRYTHFFYLPPPRKKGQKSQFNQLILSSHIMVGMDDHLERRDYPLTVRDTSFNESDFEESNYGVTFSNGSPFNQRMRQDYISDNLICPKDNSQWNSFKRDFLDKDIQHSRWLSNYAPGQYTPEVDHPEFQLTSLHFCLDQLTSTSPFFDCTQRLRSQYSSTDKDQPATPPVIDIPVEDYYEQNQSILEKPILEMDPLTSTSPLFTFLQETDQPTAKLDSEKPEDFRIRVKTWQEKAIQQFRSSIKERFPQAAVMTYDSATMRAAGKIGRLLVSIPTDNCLLIYQIPIRSFNHRDDDISFPGKQFERLAICNKDPLTGSPITSPYIFGENNQRAWNHGKLDLLKNEKDLIKNCHDCHTQGAIIPQPGSALDRENADELLKFKTQNGQYLEVNGVRKIPQWVSNTKTGFQSVIDPDLHRGPRLDLSQKNKGKSIISQALDICLQSDTEQSQRNNIQEWMNCQSCHNGRTHSPISLPLPPVIIGSRSMYLSNFMASVTGNLQRKMTHLMPPSRSSEAADKFSLPSDKHKAEGKTLAKCLLVAYYGKQMKSLSPWLLENNHFSKEELEEIIKKIHAQEKDSSLFDEWLIQPDC
jgi:hypothetical protein